MSNDFVKEYLIAISNVIRRLKEERNISQLAIVEKCKAHGIDISQATISTAICGKSDIRLRTLLAITYALDIDITEFFNLVESEKRANGNDVNKSVQPDLINTNRAMIYNPNDSAYWGFIGNYYTYFYRTTGEVKELVRGELSFKPSTDGKKCIANLKIKTGTFKQRNDHCEEIEKEYIGELVISQVMRAAYVSLFNEKAGEMCMLTFRHWYILNSSLKCTMACAVTTSSGSNRLPTIHRICISRDAISPPKMEFVKGQLLMNDANILLTECQLEELLNDPKIPSSFKELLARCAQKDKCTYFQETALYDQSLSETERIKWISYVRAHSSAPKYNKISRRTEESLFSLLEKDDI